VWPRKHLLFALVLGLAALPGCSGSDGDAEPETSPLRNLGALVLQPRDLPGSFVRFDEGRLNRTDFRPGPREAKTRFGRVDGWKARFRRSGTPQTEGPLVVDSQVDTFSNEEGAKQDLDAYGEELASPWKGLSAPLVGDESLAVTLRQGSGRFAQRYFTVAWRDRDATASVAVQGFEGKLTLDHALALAREQQAHLRAR
jgi:hypothetical protein